MSVFTVRRTVAAASMALVAATLATPASAHELDEDAIAAKICPAGISADGSDFSESADSGDEAEVDVYSYGIGETAEGDPVSLCTFAIVATDEDSKLNGSYTLTVAGSVVSGGISGNDFVTKAVVTTFDPAATATIDASGQQLTSKTAKQKKDAKTKYAKSVKSAKSKYSQTVKAAKKKYSKAKKAKKAKAAAKKAMNAKVSAARKKLAAATEAAAKTQKRQTSPTERAYSLKLGLLFND